MNFWASWCVDCKLEAGALATAERKWSGKNVVFLGVDGQDLGSAAKSYMRRYDVSYPVARDINGSAVQNVGRDRLPRDVLRHAEGRGRAAALLRPRDRRRPWTPPSRRRSPHDGRSVVLALRILAATGVVVLAAVLTWRVTHQPASGKRQVSDEKIVPAPNFTLARLNGGGKLSLASLRGKVVVINFWASDCQPCKEEMPRVEAAARRYAGKAAFVGIDIVDAKGPREGVRRALRRNLFRRLRPERCHRRAVRRQRRRRRRSSSTDAAG